MDNGVTRRLGGDKPRHYIVDQTIDIGEGQHIVILGAGIGGLCAAYLLRNSNFKITIIEPNPDVGGRCLIANAFNIIIAGYFFAKVFRLLADKQ